MIHSQFTTGWDIGGAHLKAARVDRQGKLLDVVQVECPLWLGLEYLENAIQTIQSQLDNKDDFAAITMTGELVDLFSHRQQGVEQIIDCMSHKLDPALIKVYSTKGWLTTNDAKKYWQHVASMNWHASAKLAAANVANGLFIDMGSTTCDIICLNQHQAVTKGQTDFERQTSRELLYTGTIRTPLISLARQAVFQGKSVGLAAELFATTGDTWVITEQLDPTTIQDRSADGQPWSKLHCQQRLARLLGADAEIGSQQDWFDLANWFNQQQLQHIEQACKIVLSHHGFNIEKLTIIGAGIGRFMLKQLAQQIGCDYVEFHQLINDGVNTVSDHAPATAVALLGLSEFT
jgi:probable H4MPT-linked C1 transfer pathway protein